MGCTVAQPLFTQSKEFVQVATLLCIQEYCVVIVSLRLLTRPRMQKGCIVACDHAHKRQRNTVRI